MGEKSDSDVLHALLSSSGLVKLQGSRGHKMVELVEVRCPEASIVVKQIPDDAVVINLNIIPNLGKTFFSGEKGECQCADYMIIDPDEKVAIFVEMKKRKDSLQHIKNQLMGASCLYDYCCSVGALFWHKKDFLYGFKKMYVAVVHTGSIRKRSSRNKRIEGAGVSPDNLRKISYAKHLYFDEFYVAL